MLTLERPYSHSDEDARERLRALTEYWSTKHGLTIEWESESEVHLSGRVMRVSFDGRVTVKDGLIRANVDAGRLAEKLGARGYVERKLNNYLDPANSLESLRAKIPPK